MIVKLTTRACSSGNSINKIVLPAMTGKHVSRDCMRSRLDYITEHALKKLSTKRKMKILTKKPITPSREEILLNSRSRSAKLRAAEKIS